MQTPGSAEPETPTYTWPVPPDGGWTADDLDQLPDLPRQTELIDAGLVFACRQNLFHEHTGCVIERRLGSAAPAGLEVLHAFTIDIDSHNRPAPDVIVVREDVLRHPDQTRLPADAVVLAVEVVMPGSETRDRETKPLKYARAGIPHYWRVEDEKGRVAIHVFELEPTSGAYVGTGVFRNHMSMSVPFPVDLDLDRMAWKDKD